MIGTSRRKRDQTSSSRKDSYKPWPQESDSERPRKTMGSSQRHNVDHSASNNVQDSHNRPSRRAETDLQYAPMSTYPNAPQAQYQPASAPAAAAYPSSSSRPRPPEAAQESYDSHTYLKRRTDQQSLRSSEEKVGMNKMSRSQQHRNGYMNTASADQGYSAAQGYYTPNGQSSKDPTLASQNNRDRDRDKDREKRREKERVRERARQEEERMMKEKQHRRDERHQRKEEKEREKELLRQQEEKERERARRHEEKRRAKEKEGQAKQPSKNTEYHPVYGYQTPANPVTGVSKQYPIDDRASARHIATDQIPSSSSNVALPASQHASNRSITDKERRHRSRREAALIQQNAESGMSSSEQEPSLRERRARASDRRYATREHGGEHPSGASGSETERMGYRERQRKMSRAHADEYMLDQGRTTDSRPNATHGYMSAPLGAQITSTPVGITSPQPIPRIVSIRAGQGPADPQTPLTRAKTPASMQSGHQRQASIPAPTDSLRQHSSAQSYSHTNGYPGQGPTAPVDTAARLPPINPTVTSKNPHVAVHSSSRPYTAPSPAQAAHSLGSKPSPARGFQLPLQSDTPAHYANLSVYHAPGPTVSAELVVPASHEGVSSVKFNHGHHSSKFPLNEDLQTASSSTLAPGRSGATHTGRGETGNTVPRSSTYPPVERPSPNNASMMLATPYGTQRHLNEENDIPIPIPAPGVLASMMAHDNDTRSYRTNPTPAFTTHNLLSTSQQSARPQATPLQSKPNAGAGPAYLSPGAAYSSHPSKRSPQAAAMDVLGNSSPSNHPPNHSPSHSVQQHLKGSPATVNTVPLVSATPKHSPSGRLQPRNNSSDTVLLALNKPSPPYPTNRQLAHAQPRSDTKHITTSQYPDSFAYPQLQSYSTPATAPPHQTTFAPTTTTTQSGYPQTQLQQPAHSRSASQPATHTLTAEPPQRGYTMPAVLPSNPAAAPSASALAEAYLKGAFKKEHSYTQDTSQRVPPRAAPSPAPTLTQQRQNTVPQPSSSKPARDTPPSRGQTHPTPGKGHTRNASEPLLQPTVGRVSIGGHLSTPAPPNAQLGFHPSSSELELLKTPSSIAGHTPLKPAAAPAPAKPSVPVVIPTAGTVQGSRPSKERNSRGKGGFFGLFRSRSSPPKERGEQPSATSSAPAPASGKPRQRSTSQTTMTGIVSSVQKIITPHPSVANPSKPTHGHTQSASLGRTRGQSTTMVVNPGVIPPNSSGPPASAPAIATMFDTHDLPRRGHASSQAPAQGLIPIVTPTPMPAFPLSGSTETIGKADGTKMFTPFRLLSKRHQTMSTVSVDAQDGTAANTVIGGSSARSSTAGRLSPPLRDPLTAAVEWRNREEANYRDRGTVRRRRPGIVFDVSDDFTDTETHAPARKPSVRRPS